MQLFRHSRPEGELLHVRALVGHKVLVSVDDPEDLVSLEEHQRVNLDYSDVVLNVDASYAVLPERDGCAFGFIFDKAELQPLYTQDLVEGQFVEVLS